MPRSSARAPQPTALQSVPVLRGLALGLGMLMLLAFQTTLKLTTILPHWIAVDWPDLAKHFSLVGSFALLYRLSLKRAGGSGIAGVLDAPGAALRTIAVCSSWAGLCEVLQLLTPYRDFDWGELALNIATPALIAGLVELFNPRHLRE